MRFEVTNVVNTLPEAIEAVLATTLNEPFFNALPQKAREEAALEWIQEVE